jgi:hypothetical protein
MRSLTLIAGMALTCLAVAGPAQAHVPAQSTELDWHVGLMDYDTAEDDLLLGVYLGRNLSDGWGLEAGFGLTPGEDFKGYFFNGNGVYNINVAAWERFVPFVTAGAGLFSMAPEVGDSQTDFAINFGGGAKAFLTPRLALRGDIRDHVVFSDPDATHNLQFSAGLSYFIRSDR